MLEDKPTTRAFSITDSDMDIILDAASDNKARTGVDNYSAALRTILREWAAQRADNAKKIKAAIKHASVETPDKVTVSLTPKASELT